MAPCPAKRSGIFLEAAESILPEVKLASPCQRIRTNLEFDRLGLGSLAGFAMERSPVSIGRPDATALPAGVRIVDAAIHPLGEEAERIRNPHVHPLAVHPRHQRFVGVASGHRDIGAESGRIELVNPRIVARLGAAALGHILELRPRERDQCPALRTQFAFGRLWSVKRPLGYPTTQSRMQLPTGFAVPHRRPQLLCSVCCPVRVHHVSTTTSFPAGRPPHKSNFYCHPGRAGGTLMLLEHPRALPPRTARHQWNDTLLGRGLRTSLRL